jgi:hypothetical protein
MISGSYMYMVYWPCSNSTRFTEGGSSGQRANSIDLPEGEYHPGDSLAFAGWVASPQGEWCGKRRIYPVGKLGEITSVFHAIMPVEPFPRLPISSCKFW